MGIYSDTFEDNRERAGQLYDESTLNLAFRPTQKAPPAAEPLPCPSCTGVFATIAARQKHLFDLHALEGFYVRVNEAVITDTVHFGRPIDAIELVPLGPTPVDVKVQLPGSDPVVRVLEPGSPLQVVPEEDPIESGIVALEGHVSGRQRRYEIHVGQAPILETADIDQLVMRAQMPLLDGGRAAVDILLDVVGGQRTLRDRYAGGFAEFLLAGTLEFIESDWRSAARRMEQAHRALRIFDTPLARIAVAAIDFRMNAFTRLLHTSERSAFGRAAAFFLQAPVSHETEAARGEAGIWVDDYQEGLVEAALSASQHRHAEVLERLSALPPGLGNDGASAVKLMLLAARANAGLGRRLESRSAYARLLGDPHFGSEALRYLSAGNKHAVQ